MKQAHGKSFDSPAYKGDKGDKGGSKGSMPGGKVVSPAYTPGSTTGEAKGHKNG